MSATNWEIGKTYGGFKLVAMTPTEATFELPDGSTKVYPNIFVNKAPQVKQEKSRPIRPVIRKNASEETLLQEAERIKARLELLKARKLVTA